MLIATLLERLYRFALLRPGRTGRREFFTFLTYVVAGTVILMLTGAQLPVLNGDYAVSPAGIFLALHILPVIHNFRRRINAVGGRVPMALVTIWIGLLLGFPAALELGIGALYGLVAVVIGQLLAVDQLLSADPEMQEPDAEAITEDGWDNFIWHQAPVNSLRATDEIYRAYRV